MARPTESKATPPEIVDAAIASHIAIATLENDGYEAPRMVVEIFVDMVWRKPVQANRPSADGQHRANHHGAGWIADVLVPNEP